MCKQIIYIEPKEFIYMSIYKPDHVFPHIQNNLLSDTLVEISCVV